jgi:hypothetical protein
VEVVEVEGGVPRAAHVNVAAARLARVAGAGSRLLGCPQGPGLRLPSVSVLPVPALRPALLPAAERGEAPAGKRVGVEPAPPVSLRQRCSGELTRAVGAFRGSSNTYVTLGTDSSAEFEVTDEPMRS